MQEHVADPLAGAIVDGRYRIISRLARGGMSTVYLATDNRLDRPVALKILYPHLAADRFFLERFEREAKSAARLSHPHVVGVLDQGYDGDIAYLAMEYVPGHTLRDTLNEKGALTPRLALALLDPVVEGLAAAHQAGLVHRDVKPENVLMSSDGRIKIGDFGLARAASASNSTATLIGTVAYIAPELVSNAAADARSDIYSVGIMLFEMLTGRQPFTGESSIQIAYQHVNSSVPLPSSVVPGLAPDLDELVQWCTARDPDQRPHSATALLGELRHIRTTLSDRELDFRAAMAGPAVGGVPGSDTGRLGTQPINTLPAAAGAAAADDHSEDPNRTTVIAPSYQRTTAIPRTPLPQGPVRPQVPDGTLPAVPGAARPRGLSKRQERAWERERARQARRPAVALRPGNRRRRGVVWAVVLTLLAVLAATAGWFFGMGPGAPISIPDVTGRSSADAQALLQQRGLEFSLNEVFDEQIERGLAVGTVPSPPAQVRWFEPVTLIVSKGPELFEVPKVLGLTEEQAKAKLQAANLTAGQITREYHASAPAGSILGQDPSAGEHLRRGSAIDLTASAGPEPFDVPDVTGESVEDATSDLQREGLKVSIAQDRVYDREVDAGKVVSQSPASGTVVPGDTVTLTLSLGPRMVDVPSVVGQSVRDARRTLEDLGFEVDVRNFFFGGDDATVRSQDPDGGTAPEGSVITLRAF
ncbi:Stk1 family PASTA domain-containing Ser/Thr kinase [Arthrobacter sp. I2-34]|uniref:non-specific serine/threonine protein kinase n=1 Tax=Arthrobacter hankyongi TaxID=2904801 RepID=A0ABS9LBE4_9MICC|nr:Stk1 family PASTA domain-containing Ser/Thr kinase [Arthrobacter hankyongi]MCG2623838.1 Stk1 family PASTA domain-containing Ser/Thr kinase [Arthrobacter hankyongi]